MNRRTLKKIEALARKAGHAFLATADAEGGPHIAAAGSLPDGYIDLEEWFCPGTLKNLDVNRRAAIVVWDAIADEGYQICGHVERIEEIAMMDGYSPHESREPPMPQVEQRLKLRPERIARFRKAPHTDLEE